MDKSDEIIRALGRIEGRLVGIGDLSERVSKIEAGLAWIKGGWAALAGAFAYLFKTVYAR